MSITKNKFNGILRAIKSADKKTAELIQQAAEFCFLQAADNENLTPVNKLLEAVGSARTLRHQQIKAYLLAHLSNVVIAKDGARKKAKGKPIEFIKPAVLWYEYGRNELEKSEAQAMAKVKLDSRLESIIKAVANGAKIEIKDKEKVIQMIDKLNELIA